MNEVSEAHSQAWSPVVQAMVTAVTASARPVRVIGVCGAQGSGKTTVSRLVRDRLAEQGIAAVVVSLDDFYLTRAERQALAQSIHPLCQTRGVPGTHDVALLSQALKDARNATGEFTLPRFSKALDDRETIEAHTGACLILEGWCVGVRSQPPAALSRPVNELEADEDPDGVWRRWVNDQIHEFYEPLWRLIDQWLFLQVPDFAQVYAWRAQQETAIAEAQRMRPEQLQRFIQHYERLTRWQLEQPFTHHPALLVSLNEAHGVASIERQ